MSNPDEEQLGEYLNHQDAKIKKLEASNSELKTDNELLENRLANVLKELTVSEKQADKLKEKYYPLPHEKIKKLEADLKLQEQDNERIIQSSKGAVDRMKEELRISQGIKDGSYTAPKEGWTCYHCGVIFRKPGAAADHFGEVPRSKAKCQYHDLDVEKLEAENAELDEQMGEIAKLGDEKAAEIQESLTDKLATSEQDLKDAEKKADAFEMELRGFK